MTYKKQGFMGWWVRTNPFEFEVPLAGKPVVRLIDPVSARPQPAMSFSSFANAGVHDRRPV
jgi:hypothetical protein